MKQKPLTFLQVGLGSMGKRRIRCLLHIGIKPSQIFGFDPLPARRKEVEKEYGVMTFSDFAEAVRTVQPDAYLIATPPDKHRKYFLFAAKNKKHFFAEPTTTDHGYTELARYLDGTFVAAPGCSWRFLPAIQKIHALLNQGTIGKLLSFQYHMGQYLPDWHPWEDYRKVYFAQKKTGGCREMFPFELIWLNQLVGSQVRTISGFVGKISDLEMSADDIYAAVARYANDVIGTISVDVLARTAFRTLRLIGTTGVIDWEWLDNEIKVFTTRSKKWQTIPIRRGARKKGYVTTEDMYQEEIRAFVDAVRGKRPYPYTFKEDHQILKTLFALEKSSRTGKTYAP